MQKKIRKKRVLRRPVQEVWEAISQKSRLEEWFMQNTFNSVEGHSFEFFDKPGEKWRGVYQCEIISCQPPLNLAYSWSHSKLKHTTYVWWKLDTIRGLTVLELEHSGFKGFLDVISSFFYTRFWDLKLRRLQDYLQRQKDTVEI